MAELLHDRDENSFLPDVAPEDDATILFTSGSTGEAKGALSTHRAVTTGVYAYASGLMVLLGILTEEGRPPTSQARTLLSVPLFHVTGELPVMLNSFVIGRCMVLMPKWDAAEALRLIERERITYFVGVPTMSLEIMAHPDRSKYDMSSLTDITAGGAPRPVSHVERLQREFPNAQPALGYGLTETNAVGCANFWGNYAAKPASTGRPQAPLVEVAILGAGDRHLPPGEAGEIAIRSAANIKCYWNAPEATAALFTDDLYVRTGDIGYLDEDGYLFIVDRKKEIIIRGGENISAAEVEAACYACPDIAEVSVFGVPDERLGEVPIAVIYLADGASARPAGFAGFPRRQARQIQDPRAGDHLRRTLAAPRHRQVRPPRFEGSVQTLNLDRRTLLVGGGVGVGLIVAFALWPRRLASDLVVRRGEQAFGNFIKVARNGRVTVAVPQVETGQGVWTALPQIVADELGAAWDSVGSGARPARRTLWQFADAQGYADDRRVDFGTRLRTAVARSRGGRARDARGGGCRPLERQ